MDGLRRSVVVTSLVLGVLFAGLLVAAGAPASPLSEKRAKLRAVQARLDQLDVAVSKAVEDYDQAVTRLGATREKIRQNRRQLDVAERNLTLANRQLAARAQDIYKAPEAGIVDVLFGSRSFDDLVSALDQMRRLGNSDVDLVRSVAAYERDIKGRRIALKSDEAAAAKLVAERKRQRSAVLANQARVRGAEQSLKADIRRALAAQAAARQRAAAAEVAAAAARQTTTAGSSAAAGSGGGVPAVDPGGPGHPEVVAIAQRYLGIPYVWGGASPSVGFDCSGLVMYVYAQVGIQLLHGATDQQHASTPVPLNALQPGDLVFYGNAGYSYHVAIYVGGGRTIEAARTGTPVRYGVVGSAWIGGRF
jgi:peptidoglycan DL-endopeptidase CwlO